METVKKWKWINISVTVVYILAIVAMLTRMLFLFEQTSDKTIINATLIPFGVIFLIATIVVIIVKIISKMKKRSRI